MARLLIVEVNLNQRALYSEELTDDGYEVFCAGNGPEALDIFKRLYPDLVIIDISLPCMNVVEVMTRMLDAKPDLPIVVHSAYSLPRQDCIAGMARAYVMKSGNLDELKQHVCTELTNPRIASGGISIARR